MGDLIKAMEIVAEATEDIQAAALLYHAVKALRAYEERERELVETLEPFVSVYREAMDLHAGMLADEDASPRPDNEHAIELYLCALELTWGDLRRARSILEKHKEQK